MSIKFVFYLSAQLYKRQCLPYLTHTISRRIAPNVEKLSAAILLLLTHTIQAEGATYEEYLRTIESCSTKLSSAYSEVSLRPSFAKKKCEHAAKYGYADKYPKCYKKLTNNLQMTVNEALLHCNVILGDNIKLKHFAKCYLYLTKGMNHKTQDATINCLKTGRANETLFYVKCIKGGGDLLGCHDAKIISVEVAKRQSNAQVDRNSPPLPQEKNTPSKAASTSKKMVTINLELTPVPKEHSIPDTTISRSNEEVENNFDKCYRLRTITLTPAKAYDRCTEDVANFSFVSNTNFDQCYALKSLTLNSSRTVNECMIDSAEFQFVNNANFDKCYALKKLTFNSQRTVNKCMIDSAEFQFVNNPRFDKCYRIKNISMRSAKAVNGCMTSEY